MNEARKITDDMLIQAAKVDDLDQALKSVMDRVGINDGGVAGIVFSGDGEQDWYATDQHYRLAMLREWREVELAYDIDYAGDPSKMACNHP